MNSDVLLMADAIRRLQPDVGQGRVLMWVFLGLAVYAAIATVY
jgi:hypothetical protein